MMQPALLVEVEELVRYQMTEVEELVHYQAVEVESIPLLEVVEEHHYPQEEQDLSMIANLVNLLVRI
jgi:hypothetical protein